MPDLPAWIWIGAAVLAGIAVHAVLRLAIEVARLGRNLGLRPRRQRRKER